MMMSRPLAAASGRRGCPWRIAGVTVVMLLLGLAASSCGFTSSGGPGSTLAGGSTLPGGTSTTILGQSTTTAGAGPTVQPGGTNIVMKSTAFQPSTLTVKVGTTVTWTNEDNTDHTVIADNGEFKSNDIPAGSTYSQQFTKPGTYPYHCSIHPGMTGTVVVQ